MNRLPLTVISGYLGAGKTTLLNRLLAGEHGQQLMVMVNDFGAINIDASLLASATDDTLELSNGCVCCTMGADLFMAMGDALDRRPRPDHLLIEASGIADPARIAQAAVAEPDMAYGGIVTVVDAINHADTSGDPMIGAQVRGQIAAADLILVSKCDTLDETLAADLALISSAPALALEQVDDIAAALLGPRDAAAPREGQGHGAFVSWQTRDTGTWGREALLERLRERPRAVYRVKGFVPREGGGTWEVHAVGRQAELREAADTPPALVAIAPASYMTAADLAAWW